MKSFLIRNAEIRGQRAAVRLCEGRIAQIGPDLSPEAMDTVIEANGGALLPGLRDHHIHLLALAAARASVRCGPPEVKSRAGLAQALQEAAATAPARSPLRGVGYHESVAGELDRHSLDAMLNSHPVRIQHRSGALWILNSAALALLDFAPDSLPEGVECDESGQPTGRIFREDVWLRARSDRQPAPDLSQVGALLASYGVTGVCDATPSNSEDEWALFAHARRSGALPQKLRLMGNTRLPSRTDDPHLSRGALKLILDENNLPEAEALMGIIRKAHEDGRGVAFHCVTRTELVVALDALERAGPLEMDRIEHASVTPPDLLEWMKRLPIAVVTQPNFLFERGDAYLQDVEERDQPWLYRCAGFLEARVPLAAGTDAPFGEPDPWAAMQAAVDRRSALGETLSPGEALSPEQALALFQSPLEEPGRGSSPLDAGASADLILLRSPWSRARNRLEAAEVAATWVAGERIWQRES
ncbi:MAG: amidohydrolase family protein [Myxococcota bacterium]|nr:amidohydrolase family protein [Myxococcota bacterium]